MSHWKTMEIDGRTYDMETDAIAIWDLAKIGRAALKVLRESATKEELLLYGGPSAAKLARIYDAAAKTGLVRFD